MHTHYILHYVVFYLRKFSRVKFNYKTGSKEFHVAMNLFHIWL